MRRPTPSRVHVNRSIENMGHSAKAVANYFLSKYGKNGITPLKIQKLVYLAHGWHLAFRDRPLVDDEYAEAWQYGPVYASLYHEFKHRGRMPVVELATEVEFDEEGELDETTPRIPKSEASTRKLLDAVWKEYGQRSGIELSEICHQPGSPWHQVMQESEGRRNTHIPDDIIEQYYKKKRQANQRRRNSG